MSRLYNILNAIVDKFSDSGWINLTSNGSIRYRKKTGMVYVIIESFPKPTTQVIGTLPIGYRPDTNAQVSMRSNLDTVVSSWIQANGTINVNYGGIPSNVVNIAGFSVFPEA